AIELSRASGLWTGLKIVTAVADGSSTVNLAAEWPTPRIPPGAGTHVPTARLLHPTLGQLERDLVTNRLRIAREYARLNGLNRVLGLRVGMPWPLEETVIREFGDGPKEIRVAEEKRSIRKAAIRDERCSAP